ncbi:MAG: leucyl aminopeptidase family protein [Solirubrobacteraceae bacterium]
MNVSTTTSGPLQTRADTVAVGVFEGEDVAHDLPGEQLSALLRSGEGARERGRLAVVHAEGRRFIVLGLGARDQFTPERARSSAGAAAARARELRSESLCWEVPHHLDDATIAGLVEGTLLRDYRFDRYKRERSNAGAHRLSELILSAHHDLSAAAGDAATIATAQNRARDLGNTPANELTPAALAAYATGLADRHQTVAVSALEEDAIRAAGMGAFAAVAQGSSESARLIRIAYDGRGELEGTGADAPVLALIGKAVTFDSGGLWLKPSAKMHEMKFDMCGGAAVIEAIAALAQLRAPVRVLGVVGATENMLGGSSVKPGDIVTALSSTTIEVNNTDAEGRLVLADLITYAQREGAAALVDIATLTGGVVIALGSVHAGLMGNDERLAAHVESCALRTGELVWRLPLHERYAQMVKGRYAELTNLTERREAMAITAAEFLHHFAGDLPWAHIDIAGTAWDAASAYIGDRGATGFGVRLLVEIARSWQGAGA